MESTRSKSIRLCIVQTKGRETKDEIHASVSALVREAVKAHNPRVVALPECFNGPYVESRFHEFAEVVPTGVTSQLLSGLAKDLDIYLVGGSIIERDANDPNIMYNTCTIWGPDGALLASHRKTHLCDIKLEGKCTSNEVDYLTAGDGITTFFIDGVKCGVGICYDASFDDFVKLYRKAECEVLFFPSAFNTGVGDTWEFLFRARALDNQVFVAAISPARDETAELVAWGHSFLADPYGSIIAMADISEEILFAEIDLRLIDKYRTELPLYRDRRTDLYDIIDKKEIHC